MKQQAYRFKILSTLFTIIVIIFSINIDHIVSVADSNVKGMYEAVVDDYGQRAIDDLESIRTGLENAVYSNEVNLYDDDAITDWVLEHSTLNSNIEQISLINIGYSTTDDKMDLIIKIQDNPELSNNIKNDIIKYTESIDLNNITNDEMNNYIQDISKQISSTYDIDYDKIHSILTNSLFVKDKVLFNTNYGIDTNNDGDKYWTESIVIPDGYLGFNNEPQYKNDGQNYSYKKIVITAVLNKDRILEPYNNYRTDLSNLAKTISVLLIILVLIAITYLFMSFLHILNKYNNIGGDTNAENNRHNNININRLLRVNGVRIKQIWEKFRKKH